MHGMSRSGSVELSRTFHDDNIVVTQALDFKWFICNCSGINMASRSRRMQDFDHEFQQNWHILQHFWRAAFGD